MSEELVKTEAQGVTMSISAPKKDELSELISDDKVISVSNEILEDIKKDSENVQNAYEVFYDMVVNGGDATSSSKEAMVNLLKIKSEMADKKTKVLELFMRVKLRERDTFPKYLVANQKNTIVNGSIDKKRLLLEEEEIKNNE